MPKASVKAKTQQSKIAVPGKRYIGFDNRAPLSGTGFQMKIIRTDKARLRLRETPD